MLALVTGAGGVIGPTLVRTLLSQGAEVRALVRRSPEPGILPAGTDIRVGDIADPDAVARAASGADTVFHLASIVHRRRPISAERYRRVNVEGTANVMRAAGEARVVLFSTINVYGRTDGTVEVDETGPVEPTTPYAISKAEAEAVAMAGPNTVVLRLAAVYGPTMRGNYTTLVEALRRGRFLWVGDGRNRRTLVHIEDAVRAAAAATAPDLAGNVFNVTDGAVHTVRSIVEAICRALGRPAPGGRLPAGVALSLARTTEWGAAMVGRRPPITSSAVRTFLEDLAVSGALLMARTPYRPQIDLDAGWRTVVAS
jgi:UDP-glucose 4-epimerase